MKNKIFNVIILIMIALGAVMMLAGGVGASDEAQATTRRQVTVLSSSRRITSTNSSDILNYGENLNVRGAYLTLDVTAVLTTPVITLSVQAKDPVSENYETIFSATSAVSAVGTHTYLIYPGIGSAGNDVVQVLSYPLPAEWRVSMEHFGHGSDYVYRGGVVGALIIGD